MQIRWSAVAAAMVSAVLAPHPARAQAELGAAFHFTRNATFALTGEGEVAQNGGRVAVSIGF